MTTTRHSIGRQDHPEVFPAYHNLPDSIAQSHGRYGPSNHLSLPRFSDPHSTMMINQGSLNDISFNRPPSVPHLSSQSYPFNYSPTTSIPRSSFAPLGSPGIWSAAPPPIRQVAPLPPAQGYGMGQDFDGGGGQAKRRRMNEDSTPSSLTSSATLSATVAPRLSRADVEGSSHVSEKSDHFLLDAHAAQSMSHDLTSDATQPEASDSYTGSLGDPLMEHSSTEGVSEWAEVGDFALFNDLHSEVGTDAASNAEWNTSFMSFTEDDAGAVASSNNLFDLKEDTLFPTIDRTNSAPAGTDLSLGSFEVKSASADDARVLSSQSLRNVAKLTESEATGGSTSDASTAASVSDYSVGMSHLPTPVTRGTPVTRDNAISCGSSEIKTNGKTSIYSRGSTPVPKYGWRGSEAPVQDGVPSAGMLSNEHAQRPDLSIQTLEELNDISCFKNDERYKKLIVDYTEGISFPLGEGGRELLRACLNVKGCKGRQLQGASVPALLALAKTWGLWDVAIRIKVERSCGQLCPQHDAFVKFKANQSQMRKYVKKEYMVTERDNQGCLSGIIYDERRKITLGKEGRESLRTQLRRLHDKHAGKMDELLEKHGFKYSELRNATVQQLSRMAYVCNLWDKVVAACRKQEEKRDYRNRDGSRSAARNVKEYLNQATSDHMSYSSSMQHQADPSTRIPPGLGDAWKAAYPSDLHTYGDLPANAYETDDGSIGSASRPELGEMSGSASAVADYQSTYIDAPSAAADIKSNEVRVKHEQTDDSSAEAGSSTQKPALSIEDLLSTLTVPWESPVTESIERFLQRQQQGHDSPVTEDNIFQAFSDLVPMMNGGEGVHSHSSQLTGRQDSSSPDTGLGLETSRSVVCNNTAVGSPTTTATDGSELYDHSQQNLFTLNEML